MQTNLVFDALLGFCCGYALWRGGAPERAIAGIFLTGVLATHFAVHAHFADRYRAEEHGVLLIDGIGLLGFASVALAAHRWWPLFFTAAHLIGFSGHLLKYVDPHIDAWGYNFAVAVPSYPMILALALGTWNHRRRLVRNGSDPSWTCALMARKSPPDPR